MVLEPAQAPGPWQAQVLFVPTKVSPIPLLLVGERSSFLVRAVLQGHPAAALAVVCGSQCVRSVLELHTQQRELFG